MPPLSYRMLQLRGKVRRFFQGKFRMKQVHAMIAQRQGECNRCGACCKILFRCPFLGTDAQGEYTCRIYEKRFTQCRLYPINRKDLLEVEECSYTFAEPDPAARPAVDPALDPLPESADAAK